MRLFSTLDDGYKVQSLTRGIDHECRTKLRRLTFRFSSSDVSLSDFFAIQDGEVDGDLHAQTFQGECFEIRRGRPTVAQTFQFPNWSFIFRFFPPLKIFEEKSPATVRSP